MSFSEVKEHQYLKSTQNNNIIKNNNLYNKIYCENISFRPEEADL